MYLLDSDLRGRPAGHRFQCATQGVQKSTLSRGNTLTLLAQTLSVFSAFLVRFVRLRSGVFRNDSNVVGEDMR